MEKRLKVKYVKVRMEDDLHAALKRMAKKEKRSLNKQVEVFIENGLRTELANNQEQGDIERRSGTDRRKASSGP